MAVAAASAIVGADQDASVRGMGKVESIYDPLAPLAPSHLLTALEGTLQGHRTGTHLMETKRQVRE